MESIERKLLQLLETGQAVKLDELGGFMACYQNADVIAKSRMMDEFLKAILEDDSIDNEIATAPLLEEIVSRCFVENNDLIAIRNSVQLLCTRSEKLAYCFDILIKRAEDRTNVSLNRGYFLLGAFEIAVKQKSKKFELVSYLVSIDLTDDFEYLKYVAKIIGVCYSAFRIEDLAEKLADFVAAKVGEDDALYESALCFLAKAFNSSTHEQAAEHFESALYFFQHASAYGRLDADIYTAALLTLKQFVEGADPIEISTQLEKLKYALTIYAAWDTYNAHISWVSLRNTELFNWYELSDYLTSLLEQFALPAWLEPIWVIEKYLLRIYDCSRSIFKQAVNGSLELVLRPVIQAKFIEQPEKIFLLESWINKSSNPDLLSVGKQLRTEIDNFKVGWFRGNGVGAAFKGITDVVPSITKLPPDALTEFESFVVGYRLEQTTDVSLILQKKFDELVSGLKVVESYNYPEIQKEFNTILFHSLRFLELRMDNTSANHPKAKYLFENKTLPKESALQNDYFEFMQPINLKGKIRVEQMDIGGGRADVYFEYLLFNFCTEVKRDSVNTSFEAIKEKYLGQAKEYQNTTAKVGILLVLDLLAKPNGIGSFESNVKLEIITGINDPESRGIVVIKVPGNRLTPSKIRL